jgi:hypothetical protein
LNNITVSLLPCWGGRKKKAKEIDMKDLRLQATIPVYNLSKIFNVIIDTDY